MKYQVLFISLHENGSVLNYKLLGVRVETHLVHRSDAT
jgi:hypothetical protein